MVLPLADPLDADPRLKPALSVAERYLPLPDFARRLADATGERIGVDAPLRTRKLVLFVNGRPVAETMARVADALDARWTPSEGGWTLLPTPESVRVERETRTAEANGRRKAVTEWLTRASAKPKDLRDRMASVRSALLREIGTERAAATLLAGKPLVATGDGRAGTAMIPFDDAFEGLKVRTMSGEIATPTNGMIVLRFDPSSGRLSTNLRTFGLGEGSVMSSRSDETPVAAGTEPDPFVRHTEAWAKEGDPAVAEVPLKTLAPEGDPYGAGLASYADVLARLHARTGVPVAAESFRAPFGAWGDPAGATVRDALRSTDAARIAGVRPVVWKGVRGWLLARYVDAWQMREGEIPEGRLLPLERRGVPTLDEYAALAGSLTEPQRAALAEFRPLARFPTLTIRKGYWGLFVFDALPTALRARSATALPLAALPPVTQARWRLAVVEQTYEGAPPEGWIDAVLNDRVPLGAGFLFASGNASVSAYDRTPLARDGGRPVRYRAFFFRFAAEGQSIDVYAPTVPSASQDQPGPGPS